MFAALAQTAGPAVSSAGKFMAPVVKEAAHGAAVGASQFVIMTIGTAAVASTAVGLALVGRKAMSLMRLLPRPHVRVSWDQSWETPHAADAESVQPIEPGSANRADSPAAADGLHPTATGGMEVDGAGATVP
jgi:hypothetical protein